MREIDGALVRRLLAAQAPQWASLPIRPVRPGGHDNRTFRLGADLSVRLPSADGYASQAAKEHEWLPRLSPVLPLPIPASLLLGSPSGDFPWPWSVREWIAGRPLADVGPGTDEAALARDLASFRRMLGEADATDGPAAGPQSWHRGGDLAVYDGEARAALSRLQERIDEKAALRVWERATGAAWDCPPVWVHGDVAAGNLLMREGRLGAVIDWGCAAVGDPACDLVPAWTILSAAAAQVFHDGLPYDADTWARARGWALWKAAITADAGGTGAAAAERVLGRVLAEPVGAR